MNNLIQDILPLFKGEIEEINFSEHYTLDDPTNDFLVGGFSKDYASRLKLTLKKGALSLFLTDGGNDPDKKRKFIIGSAWFEHYDRHYGTRLVLKLEEIVEKYDLNKKIALCDTSDVFERDGQMHTAWTIISKKLNFATLEIYT